jgi:CSLREA domain-containing protein
VGSAIKGRVSVVVAALMATSVCAGATATAATLTVTTTADSLTAGDDQCSLREAIDAVNAPGTETDCGEADTTSNTITLGAKQYVLSILAVLPADGEANGDLDITTAIPLTITGAGDGEGGTDISGAGAADRVLHVMAGAQVTIKNLEISSGHAPDGADGSEGIAGGAGAAGGGIENAGSLTLDDVAVEDDRAGSGGNGGGEPEGGIPGYAGTSGGSAGEGGGIFNTGTLAMTGVTVSHDLAGAGGTGGKGGTGASGSNSLTGFAGGTGGAGSTGGAGGGLANDVGGTVAIAQSTFSMTIPVRAGPEAPGVRAAPMGASAAVQEVWVGAAGRQLRGARSRARADR